MWRGCNSQWWWWGSQLRVLEVYNRKIYKKYGREESLACVTPKDQLFA